MRPSEVLPLHRETIRQLVAEAGMTNPRVFGSVVRGEDEEGSDLDILVDPAPRQACSMLPDCRFALKMCSEFALTC